MIDLQVKESDNSDKYITRKGILTRYPQAQATVVICHGFMCDKYDISFLRQIFNKGRYNTLVFDFRAHGEETEGQVCTFGKDEAHDVTAAAQFVRNHEALSHLPVYVYGFSMGAASAIQAQAHNPQLFDAMILDCPYASTEQAVKRAIDLVKVAFFGYEFSLPCKQLLEKYAFNPYVQSFIKYMLKASDHMGNKDIVTNVHPIYPIERIKNITVPCLFIHCKNDEKISIEDARALYSNAPGFKRLWLTDGRHHYDSYFFRPEKYQRKVRKFLNNVLDSSWQKEPQELVWEDGKKKEKNKIQKVEINNELTVNNQ